MDKQICYTKNLPFYGNYDVLVVGGGPAGVCAAISAGRLGLKVLLIESTGMLGGMATSGLVQPFMTVYDRDGDEPTIGGIYREIIERLSEFSAVIAPEETDSPSVYTSFITKYHRHVTPFNSYMLQVVLDKMVQEANVEVLLYTRFADCICEDGHIKHVVLSALEGLVSVSGEVIIDCTGNADVAAASNVYTYKGDEETGVPQPATLMFEVGNAEYEKNERPIRPVKAYRTPRKGVYSVNHYHVYSVDATNSKSMSDAHRSARLQVLDAYKVLREETPGFENCEIFQVAPVLGVRESRHIDGVYKITVDDVANGTKYPDRIAVYGFGMDIHSRNEKETGNFKIEVAKRYYIPYRSMLPKGVDNLLVAGKTISCESQAAGGLRCMPCAMAMGQAAGTAAFMAVSTKKTVNEIDISKLKSILKQNKAILD